VDARPSDLAIVPQQAQSCRSRGRARRSRPPHALDFAAAAAMKRPAFTSNWIVTHMPATQSDRDGVEGRAAGLAHLSHPTTARWSRWSTWDDFPAAEQQPQTAKGPHVTVLLIGVQGLHGRPPA
jgi:hypothetical protein